MMESIPLELVQRIFAYLDLASVRDAALSCRTFLDAFQNAEVLITSEILLRQIDPSVLPEAILVHKSWQLGKISVDQAIKFAQDHLSSRAPPPTQWRLVDALPLERFHRYVDYFANRFASQALEKQPRLHALREPSHAELFRFQRAFYRFQLYCNIVGHEHAEQPAYREMFFGHFAAWENEQLACVNDYLMRTVAKPFNCLVDHDVTWGYMQIPYINSHYSSYGQYLISEGLEKLYQVSQGSSYKEWHALLSKGEDRWEEPLFSDTFLVNGLERGANVFPLYLDALADLDEEDKQDVVGSPFYEEPDRGPASMWEWVHKDRLPGALVGEPRMRQHREWAYTFWDCSRLESAGLLTDPITAGLGPLTELGLEEYDTPERQANLAMSQASRAKVWESGGTGWWSATDQTKVVWPKPNRTSTRIIQPRSLADAKKFLLGFKTEKC